MEFYYYIFEIKYYDDGNDYKEREERGVICASSKADIIEKLEQWFGKNNIYDIDNFKLLGRGIGIDEKEFYIITHSAADCLKKKISPLSDAIVKQIKKVKF